MLALRGHQRPVHGRSHGACGRFMRDPSSARSAENLRQKRLLALPSGRARWLSRLCLPRIRGGCAARYARGLNLFCRGSVRRPRCAAVVVGRGGVPSGQRRAGGHERQGALQFPPLPFFPSLCPPRSPPPAATLHVRQQVLAPPLGSSFLKASPGNRGSIFPAPFWRMPPVRKQPCCCGHCGA